MISICLSQSISFTALFFLTTVFSIIKQNLVIDLYFSICRVNYHADIFFKIHIDIQGISEKCTGAFKFGCRVIFLVIYQSKSCRKSGLTVEFPKIMFTVCLNLITNINIYFKIFSSNFQVLFLMYIMTPVLKTSRRLFL